MIQFTMIQTKKHDGDDRRPNKNYCTVYTNILAMININSQNITITITRNHFSQFCGLARNIDTEKKEEVEHRMS